MISVIIPVYNTENYLYNCLNSVLNQTYDDFEVICINDCSTDSSPEILEYYSRKDERIKVIHNEINKGSGYSRNRGLDESKGEFIFFLDGDDFISSNTLEELYYNIKNNSSDIVIYKLARFMDNYDLILNRPAFDLDNIFKDVDFNNFTFNYSDIKKHVMNTSFAAYLKLYRKSFLENYDDFYFPLDIKIGEDVPFHVKTLIRASKISFVPKFLYSYRLSNVTSSTSNKDYASDSIIMCNLVEEFLKEEKYYEICN